MPLLDLLCHNSQSPQSCFPRLILWTSATALRWPIDVSNCFYFWDFFLLQLWKEGLWGGGGVAKTTWLVIRLHKRKPSKKNFKSLLSDSSSWYFRSCNASWEGFAFSPSANFKCQHDGHLGWLLLSYLTKVFWLCWEDFTHRKLLRDVELKVLTFGECDFKCLRNF